VNLITRACKRCHGDMARVEDIGDTYYSCVQCGGISYHLPVRAAEPVEAVSRPASRRAA